MAKVDKPLQQKPLEPKTISEKTKPIHETLDKTNEALELLKLSGESAVQTVHHVLPKIEAMVKDSGWLRLVVTSLGFVLLLGLIIWEFIRSGGKMNPISVSRGAKLAIMSITIALTAAGLATGTFPIMLVAINGVLLAAASVKFMKLLNIRRKFNRQRKLLQHHRQEILQQLSELPEDKNTKQQRLHLEHELHHVDHLLQANQRHRKKIRGELVTTAVEITLGAILVAGAATAIVAAPIGIGLMLGAAVAGLSFAVGKAATHWIRKKLKKSPDEQVSKLETLSDTHVARPHVVANTKDIMSDLYSKDAKSILQQEVQHDQYIQKVQRSLTIMSQHYEHRQFLAYLSHLLEKPDPEVQQVILHNTSAMTTLSYITKGIQRGHVKDEKHYLETILRHDIIKQALLKRGVLLAQDDDASDLKNNTYRPELKPSGPSDDLSL